MSTPQTTIHICSGVRLNNNYDHTITFPSRDAQVSYFMSKVVKTFTNYTYLRKRWSVKVAATMVEARRWSYLFFMNPDEPPANKRWAYYFITDVEYVNDATVELSLELDVMQTYAFDYNLQDCFVEREHSVNDVYGENTNDEGLDTGDLMTTQVQRTTTLNDLCILIMSTIDLVAFYKDKTETRVLGDMKDGVFCGMGIYAVDSSQYTKLQTLLKNLDDEGKTDAIVSMWMYPRVLVRPNPNQGEWETGDPIKYIADNASGVRIKGSRPARLGNYNPVNNKLRQYPYSMLYVTNNNGGAATFKYENWELDPEDYGEGVDYVLNIYGALGADGVVKMSPQEYYRYCDVAVNHDDGLTLAGYPTCGWNSDTYKLWLAQNQSQHALTRAQAGLTVAAGVATAIGGVAATAATGGAAGLLSGGSIAGGVGMVASGLTQIAQLNAQTRDYDVQPPAARGAQSSNVNIATGAQCFTLIHKCVDECHARRIDDYFTMYGYKTCRVKKPNVDSRPHFNYVKTVASNVRGNICARDLATINAVFDRGVTFWKNGDEIGDYSVDNRPS